jgi:hypothetical protein
MTLWNQRAKRVWAYSLGVERPFASTTNEVGRLDQRAKRV